VPLDRPEMSVLTTGELPTTAICLPYRPAFRGVTERTQRDALVPPRFEA
jgi:hypothetical protein